MKGRCICGETLVPAAGSASSALTLISALLQTARGKEAHHFMHFVQESMLHQVSTRAALAHLHRTL